jgi:hypothetical protein
MKFASEPIRVQFRPNVEVKGTAIRWYGDNAEEVAKFLGYVDFDEDGHLTVLGEEGAMTLQEGDWLILLDEAPELPAPATSLFFDALFEPVP